MRVVEEPFVTEKLFKSPSELEAGVYWYMVPGKPAEISEKRDGDDFMRFMNGRRQSWRRDNEFFVGPIAPPTE